MHRLVVLLAGIGVMASAMMPVAGRAQQGPSTPFVAVFEMQNDGSPLRPDAVSRMGNYLFTNLAACGAYRLVPQDQVRERLARQKTESYRECYDQSCQIELSREMAADKALSSSVTKVGVVCQVSASLYDLRTAAIDLAAVADGPCTEEGIRGAILKVVARLCGGGPGQQPAVAPASGPVAPPPTWDHQGTTAVVPDLPAVAEERGVLRVEGTPRNARVDVTGPRGFGTNGSLATALPYGPATVPAGEYRVQVSAPDFDADTRTVTVYADRTALVEVALVPPNGVLELWGTPVGAKVELTCPKGFSQTFGLPGTATAIPVPRGTCWVQVARNGYQPFERQVDVVGGRTVRVDVKLVQIPDPHPPRAPSAPSGAAAAGTWRDPSTGLTWQNPAPDKKMNWKSARSYCASLSLAGGGWRLPKISELRSLIRGCGATQTGGGCGVTNSCRSWGGCSGSSCSNGCISGGGPANGCYWPDEMVGICGWYWSSSSVADRDARAFGVNFANGHVFYDGTGYGDRVRCVR